MTNANTNVTLEAKVAQFKLIARDALRAKLISPRLSNIATIENNIKDSNDNIAKTNHKIAVEKYEVSVMDVKHPDYAERLEARKNNIPNYESIIKSLKESIETYTKAIEEQKKGIALIESGETKFSLDALNDLVEKLINEDAREQVRA